MRLYERVRLNAKDIGKKFGDWTQVGPSFRTRLYGTYERVAVCECKCGAVSVNKLGHLRSGASRGCAGCRGEKTAVHRRTHGQSKTREYKIWNGIKKRCFNPNCAAYKNYGGRGIVMSDKWRSSFQSFLDDVGLSPTDMHELDRTNNNGNYEPGNVRWVLPRENALNTRRNRLIEYRGERLPMSELARRNGKSSGVLEHRLSRGWSVEDAVNRPVANRGQWRKWWLVA
jgi:hypothetical protein